MKVFQFTRLELYNLIWKESISSVSRRLSIDAVLLRHKCKEHNIPTPDSGYWSKLKFNKKVSITPLPEEVNSDDVITIKFEKQLENSKNKKFETEPEKNSLQNLPHKPHPFVEESKKGFYFNMKKRTSLDGMFGTGKRNLSIYVTPNTIDRALWVFDKIIKMLEIKGYKVSVDEYGTYGKIDDIKIPIRIREKNNRIAKREQRFSWTEYDFVPSGKLVFVVELYSYRRKEFYENTVKLENKIDKIVDEIISQGINEKKYQLQCEIHRKEETERKEKETVRIQAINSELAKFKDIFVNQERWHKANIMRQYLDKYEQHFTDKNKLDDQKKSWLQWARKKADWYDPFVELEDLSLTNINRNKLEPIPIKYSTYW